jgi:ankyrin repeat protein
MKTHITPTKIVLVILLALVVVGVGLWYEYRRFCSDIVKASEFHPGNPTDELRAASIDGDIDRARFWLAQGGDVNDDQMPHRRLMAGHTALACAALGGHVEIVQLLLEHGADPEAGRFPSLIAAVKPWGSVPIEDTQAVLDLLLEAGADINRPDPDGPQPWVLGEVAWHGDAAILEYLLANGLEIDLAARPNPLFRAWCNLEMMSYLLDLGFDVNARRETDRRTPLHSAAVTGHLEEAQLLLEHGADVNARDREGKTPLDLAREHGYSEVVDYLESQVGM